ncbi:acetate uptake transporter [Escherichia coli]
MANPAPLGLMGFGMTTILLNLHNVGYFALDGIIIAMGIFYGGIAQKFLLSLSSTKRRHSQFNRIHLLRFFLADAGCDSADAELGSDRCAECTLPWCLLGLWGVFTLFMFFGTLKGARVLQFVSLA